MWILNHSLRLEHPQTLANRSTKILGFSFTMVQNPRYAVPYSRNRFVLLNELGLCVRLESNKHEYSGNWVGLLTPKTARRTDGDTGQRMRWYISGTCHLAPGIRPRLHQSRFRTSPTKTNEISPAWTGAQMGNSWLPVRLMGICGCALHLQSFIWEMLSSRSVANTRMVRASG